MRLKSEIWVQAYLRTCSALTIPAVLVRRGDTDAGAIFLQINRRDGTADLFGPAPAGHEGADGDRAFTSAFDTSPRPLADIEARLRSEARIDPDFWHVEVEAPNGWHGLDDWLLKR